MGDYTLRKILFRAWDSTLNKMVTDFFVYANGDIHNDTGDTERYAGHLCNERFKLMQFTGLHDKNKKEIWEGDIVRYSESTGTVEYDLSNVGGCRFFINSNEYRAFEDEMGTKFAWYELEVLGNIYENPELIK